jgi:hypothetical protein
VAKVPIRPLHPYRYFTKFDCPLHGAAVDSRARRAYPQSRADYLLRVLEYFILGSLVPAGRPHTNLKNRMGAALYGKLP